MHLPSLNACRHAIIGLLLAILVPSLARAKEKAGSSCKANLNLGMAMKLYLNETPCIRSV